MQIRNALPEDAPSIQSLYRQLVGDSSIRVTAEGIAALTNSGRSVLFACEVCGDVVGTVSVHLCPDVMYGAQPFAVVENLVVDDRHRAQGIGAALLAAVDQFCLGADCSKIMLMSSVQRTHAHRLFLRQGYRGDSKRGFVRYRRDMEVSQE